MGWFDRKKPEPIKVEPTPEEIAAAEHTALLDRLDHSLRNDPSFMVMTVDCLDWICPFTGDRIPAPFGFLEPAKEYLARIKPWIKQPTPKPVADLNVYRWLVFLRERMELEITLRTFGPDGRWLNPFNGNWVRLKSRNQTVDAEMMLEIAYLLKECPEAQAGKMLDRYRLEEEVRKIRFSTQQKVPVTGSQVRGTTRISGSRASSPNIPAPESGSIIDEDMEKAERLITKLLSPLPQIAGFGFTVHYEPHSQVGGDFYECKEVEPGKFFIALADVTGHGVQGALVVVAALKTLRFVLQQERDLVAILTRLNDEVKQDLLQGQFITMFAGILEVASNTFTCVCAGHHPSILVSRSRDQMVERIGPKGAALGLLKGDMFKRSLRPKSYQLQQGDTIIMYTDGLTEVHNFKRVEYGDYRMIGTLVGNIEMPYDEVVHTLVQSAREFASGTMDDDVTVMSLSIDMPKEAAEAMGN